MNLKTSLSFLAVLCMLTILSSCGKYDDGPMLSLRTRTERIANTWQVDNYKINGNDYTSLVAGYTETYKKDGDYMYNWGGFNGTGYWEFTSKDAEVSITGITNQSPRTLVILRLTEKELWYYYLDDGDKHEFHMIEQ
jgi:hypothetical protein